MLTESGKRMAVVNVEETRKALLQTIMLELIDDSDEDECSEEEMLLIFNRMRQRMLRQPSEDIPRIRNYIDNIVPSMSEQDFFSHFRMTRRTFMFVHNLLLPTLRQSNVSMEKQLMCTLWLLGTQDSFRSVGQQFGLSKGTLHKLFIRTCKSISGKAPDFIKWPQQHELIELSRKFEEKAGFPGVIGCMDGTHIPIRGPTQHRASYVNKDGSTSLQMQAVCDPNLRFLDICVGFPGSVHDARVFRNSEVPNKLLNIGHSYHVLADSAYPLQVGVMVPYRNNGHLTNMQMRFNARHSKTRARIEHAFGLLKVKFRRLKMLDMALVAEMPHVILAACVLHNIIIANEDAEPPQQCDTDDDIDGLDEDLAPIDTEAARKRNEIAERL